MDPQQVARGKAMLADIDSVMIDANAATRLADACAALRQVTVLLPNADAGMIDAGDLSALLRLIGGEIEAAVAGGVPVAAVH